MNPVVFWLLVASSIFWLIKDDLKRKRKNGMYVNSSGQLQSEAEEDMYYH